MPRLMLSDEHWSKLKGIMLHDNIYGKRNLRLIFEGMLYRMQVAAHDEMYCILILSTKISINGQRKKNGLRRLKGLHKILIRSGNLLMVLM